ncbi:MAG TPA: RNA polymerase sigma factor [bacterium]|nr:RNA polymerase sigma factor [bacterium]
MEELIKNNLDTIFSYSIFITGNREKALDLMQETILTVLKKKHLYQERSHFRSWIFRVLKNNYINMIKKDNIRNETSLSDLSKEGEETPVYINVDESGMESLHDPILKTKINKIFYSMPIEYKEVVTLVELDELSYEDVSQALEIPLGTVMSRLHRGRAYLRKMLRKEAGELRIVSKKDKKNA